MTQDTSHSDTTSPKHRAHRVRALNDAFRQNFVGGSVMITSGIDALDHTTKVALLVAVRDFTTFDHDNDPHGEHDFGSVTIGDTTAFFKIDTYDRTLTAFSPDPSDPTVTSRVLTIMLAHEY